VKALKNVSIAIKYKIIFIFEKHFNINFKTLFTPFTPFTH